MENFDVYKNSKILNMEIEKKMTPDEKNEYYDSFKTTKTIILKFQKFCLVDEQKECSICYDKKSNLLTECKHHYCYSCLNNWYWMNFNWRYISSTNISFSCPMCRKSITDIDFIAITLKS